MGAEPIQVACAADASYVPHCATMLYSVLQHNPGAIVHFLHGENLDTQLLCELGKFVDACGGTFQSHCLSNDKIAGLPAMERIPGLMWYRVYLSELLPNLDRILYLDCDTIVRKDLGQLWATPLAEAYVAAVDNVAESAHRQWVDQLGVEQYFNSGVLLFNLAQMRRDGVLPELLAFGRNNQDRLKWPDQDALNVCLGGRRVRLHPRWNCQGSLFYFGHAREAFSDIELQQATSDPAILHFEGDSVVKPWHILCKHPWRRAYLDCRKKTPWPLLSYEDDSWFNRLLRFLPEKGIWTVLGYKYRLRALFSR